MNRKLIRPNLSKAREKAREKKSKAKRRPPEQTGAEEFYYIKQMEGRTPMVIQLLDGETVEGVIEWYDRKCIKVHRDQEPNLLIPKHSIKYLYKREELTGEADSDLKLVEE